MKLLSVLLATVIVSIFAISCERHEFDGPNGTRQLHEHHEHHEANAAEGGAHAADAATHEGKAVEPSH